MKQFSVTQWVFSAVLFVLIVGMVISALVTLPLGKVFEGERERAIRLQREQALADLDASRARALEPVVRAFYVGCFGLAFALGCVGVYVVAVKARLWALQVRADPGGLYPLVDASLALANYNESGAQLARCTPMPENYTDRRMVTVTAGQVAGALPPAGALPALPGLPDQVNLLDIWTPASATTKRLLVGQAAGGLVTAGVSELCHSAVGGSSGWGKSVFLQSLALQAALAREKPGLVLIDLEGDTFRDFRQCDRLRYPVAETEQDARAVLADLVGWLDDTDCETVTQDTLVLIDESTALLSDGGIESLIKTLALRARKYRLWLFLGGQDWKAASLDTAIRNQLSSRFQFYANDATQSRVLLGSRGAESITVKGRALARLPGRSGLVTIQAPWVSSADVESLLTGQALPVTSGQALPVTSGRALDDLAEQDRIRAMAAAGLSLNEIQNAVYGYTGGQAYARVKAALG